MTNETEVNHSVETTACWETPVLSTIELPETEGGSDNIIESNSGDGPLS